MTAEEKQFKKMTETPIKKLIISLAIPTTISMIITAIYNIGDTFFVSHLGASVSGAVGVFFPIQAIIQAIGFTLGMGGGSFISSLLGQKKNDEAQYVGSSAFYFALVMGVVISIVGILFAEPLLILLGSTDTVLPYAKQYAFYILLGAPLMTGSFVMNNLLRAEGKAKFSMIGLTTGGILNLILDPIFINDGGLGLGIAGAAIATVISQGVSFLILLSMFLLRKSIIHLSPLKISLKPSLYGEIIKIGLPSLARQGLASIATILLNKQAGTFGGDAALSAMTIVSKVFMFIFSLCLGIGQGYQPVCGYNYFAKKYDRVKKAMYFTFSTNFAVLLVTCLLCIIFSKQVMGFFIDDEDVIKIGANAVKFQCISMPFLAVNTTINMTYQSTRQKVKATFLSSCRQGVFFIPLIFILPAIFANTSNGGILGVELTQAVSDFLTFVISVPFLINMSNVLDKKSKETNIENLEQLDI